MCISNGEGLSAMMEAEIKIETELPGLEECEIYGCQEPGTWRVEIGPVQFPNGREYVLCGGHRSKVFDIYYEDDCEADREHEAECGR